MGSREFLWECRETLASSLIPRGFCGTPKAIFTPSQEAEIPSLDITFETLTELVRQLPPEERQRLFSQFAEEPAQAELSPEGAGPLSALDRTSIQDMLERNQAPEISLDRHDEFERAVFAAAQGEPDASLPGPEVNPASQAAPASAEGLPELPALVDPHAMQGQPASVPGLEDLDSLTDNFMPTEAPGAPVTAPSQAPVAAAPEAEAASLDQLFDPEAMGLEFRMSSPPEARDPNPSAGLASRLGGGPPAPSIESSPGLPAAPAPEPEVDSLSPVSLEPAGEPAPDPSEDALWSDLPANPSASTPLGAAGSTPPGLEASAPPPGPEPYLASGQPEPAPAPELPALPDPMASLEAQFGDQLDQPALGQTLAFEPDSPGLELMPSPEVPVAADPSLGAPPAPEFSPPDFATPEAVAPEAGPPSGPPIFEAPTQDFNPAASSAEDLDALFGASSDRVASVPGIQAPEPTPEANSDPWAAPGSAVDPSSGMALASGVETPSLDPGFPSQPQAAFEAPVLPEVPSSPDATPSGALGEAFPSFPAEVEAPGQPQPTIPEYTGLDPAAPFEGLPFPEADASPAPDPSFAFSEPAPVFPEAPSPAAPVEAVAPAQPSAESFGSDLGALARATSSGPLDREEDQPTTIHVPSQQQAAQQQTGPADAPMPEFFPEAPLEAPVVAPVAAPMAAPATAAPTTQAWESEFVDLFEDARKQAAQVPDTQLLSQLTEALAEVRKAAG